MKQVLPKTEMPSSNSHNSATDRISTLPNELLRHILSYLTAQEAVQTCVLSPRWQNVWESATWLNADAAKFSSMKIFKKFVDNLLLRRICSVPLDALWISAACDNADDTFDYSDIHPWVLHAIRSNAWCLGITKHSGAKPLSTDGYPFPFTSTHLKELHLYHFSIDDCFVRKLSSGCPLLDDLELITCSINVTKFSSTKLKRLVITATESTEDLPRKFEHLVIDMPNLVSLRLEEIPRRNIHLVNVSSVEMASIYLYAFSFKNSEVDCNILSALSNATSLELISPSVYEHVVPKVLLHDLPTCQTFSNLTTLTLGEWFLRDGCYPLLCLLRLSPNIEKICLQLFKFGADDYDDHVKFPNAAAEIDPPHNETEKKFNCEKLTEIEIFYPPGDKRVHIVVKILVDNISPLPEIKIKPFPVSHGDLDFGD